MVLDLLLGSVPEGMFRSWCYRAWENAGLWAPLSVCEALSNVIPSSHTHFDKLCPTLEVNPVDCFDVIERASRFSAFASYHLQFSQVLVRFKFAHFFHNFLSVPFSDSHSCLRLRPKWSPLTLPPLMPLRWGPSSFMVVLLLVLSLSASAH
jgi:hypothetical protein